MTVNWSKIMSLPAPVASPITKHPDSISPQPEIFSSSKIPALFRRKTITLLKLKK